MILSTDCSLSNEEIMLRNEVDQQPEYRCIDQREQPADKPEADAGILQPQQQQKCCNADHKAQRRMNCGELIAAHSGGNAESDAVKENDMPQK